MRGAVATESLRLRAASTISGSNCLPSSVRCSTDEQVADLWLGWSAARHGHGAAFLVKQFGLPLDVAEALVRLNASNGP